MNDLERRLMPVEHELALIHMGYNPEEASTERTSDIPTLLTDQILGKPQSPFLLFNYGGYLKLEERERDGQNKLQSYLRTKLPPFGISTFSQQDDGGLYLCFQTVRTDDDKGIFLAYSIDNHTFNVIQGERYSHLNLYTHGANHRNFDLWPFGMEGFPSEVVAPFLPIEERDAMFWRKTADAYDLALGEPARKKDGAIAYEVSTNNPNVESLMFSSNPREDSTGDLVIEARFTEAVGSEGFVKFHRLFGGRTHIELDERYVVHGSFKGNLLHAEIPKGKNFLASGLISYIDSMK